MKCLDVGALQAYLDSELPPDRMRRAAAHLEVCAACRERFGCLEAAARRVNSWLDALAPEDLPARDAVVPPIAARTAAARWPWAAVALGGALAASFALFLAGARPPGNEVHIRKPLAPLAYARGSVAPVSHPAGSAGGRPVTRRLPARRPKPQPSRNDFVAFADADPMQIGMVVRVMLPVSDPSLTGAHEVAADVVIGEDGQARGFRFVR